MISGDDVPGSPCRASGTDGFFIDLHVVVPEGSFGNIGRREFPVLFRVFQPFDQSLALFILGNVKEEFENKCAVVGQVSFKGIDISKTVSPEVIVDCNVGDAFSIREFGVNPNDKYFLKIRTVKDANSTAFGQLWNSAKESCGRDPRLRVV